MRLPNLESYENNSLIDKLHIHQPRKSKPSNMVTSDKDVYKLIKTVERTVRSSLEYKDYIAFLRDKIDMKQCAFFNNVSIKQGKRVSIEIHHEPFTLYDIVSIVVKKFIHESRELDIFDISDEVMRLHYANMVGLIPLSKTVHGLVHDGKVFIPMQIVYGNYLEFIEEYNDFIPDDIKSMLQVKIHMSKEINELEADILEKKYVYLDVDGFTLPHII